VDNLSDILKLRLILFWILFIVIPIAYNGCGKNSTESENPGITNLIAPDTIDTDSTSNRYFSVEVSDPQGLENIDIVFFVIESSPGNYYDDTLYMNDEGIEGDSTAGDGIFSYVLNDPGIFEQNGQHVFHFLAIDLDGHHSNSLVENILVAVYPNPYIYDLEMPDSIPFGFADSVKIRLSAGDLQGLDDIVSVYFLIEEPYGSYLPDTLRMDDDGMGCDETAMDGIYSYCLCAPDTSGGAGDYIYHFYAIDQAANLSSPIHHVMAVVDRPNPYVFNLVGPDSMTRGAPDTAYLFVSAWDPQGLTDIYRVYFTVRRPDGTSNNTGYLLFDNGPSGDAGDSVASDGIYTQGIQMQDTVNTQTGDYTFYFTAVDTDSNHANLLTKIITAYNPGTLALKNFPDRINGISNFYDIPPVEKIGKFDFDW
jgi:hypothetical protein